MGRLRPSHLVEAGLWLASAAVLFALSFKFNQTIEIYKFGASAWPRALLFLIVLGALGQLYWQYHHGDSPAQVDGRTIDDAVTDERTEHSSLGWYANTAVLVALPFLYMRVPDWIGAVIGLEQDGLGPAKLMTGAAVIVAFGWLAKGNHVGGMLGLPIMFAAMLQDFGFYALAPFFGLGVMYLMGERRGKWMVPVMALLFAILVLLFVKILYVGLPTGNIEPFYTIGTTIVKWLQ